MILVCLQELESWMKYFYWALPADGASDFSISARVAGEVMHIVPRTVELKAIGVIGKSDSANIVRGKKAKRLTERMRTNEKDVLPKKRWATQVPTLPPPCYPPLTTSTL